MKRMVTDEQIIDLIQKYAPGFDPSAIEEGDIPQNAILGIEDGEIVKGPLFGKYVRIVNASDLASPITDEMREILKEGVFVNGRLFGVSNPVLFPTITDGTADLGIYVHANGISTYKVYEYPVHNTMIRVGDILTLSASHQDVNLKGRNLVINPSALWVNGNDPIYLRQKAIPVYPTNQTDKKFHFTLDNGALTWQEGNGLYLHTVVFDVGAGQSFTIRLISDSATTCALDAGTNNFTIPGSTFIQPVNMGNVVIVPLDANKFTPDIYAFNSATGAFTDHITLASVTSDTMTPIR